MNQDEPIFDGDLLLEMVENQLSDNYPPCVKATLMRLAMTGHAQDEARHLIACALGAEIMMMQETGQPFSEERYAEYLAQLPAMPWDEDT